MARPEKVAAVEALAGKLRSAQSMVLADYTGLTVEKMTAFRVLCRAKGVECQVVKNRLAGIAAGDLTIIKDHLKGPTALIMGRSSQIDPAKIVVEFAKDNAKLRIKGGLLDGRFLDPAAVESLSRTPDREVLLAQTHGWHQQPGPFAGDRRQRRRRGPDAGRRPGGEAEGGLGPTGYRTRTGLPRPDRMRGPARRQNEEGEDDMSDAIKLSDSAQKVLDLIEKMTLLEAADLVKAMEEKFGAPPPPWPWPPPPPPPWPR